MNKHTSLIVFLVLVAIIAYAFYTAVDVFGAYGNDSLMSYSSVYSVCNTVDGNSVAAYDGHNVDAQDANSRHCESTGKNSYTIERDDFRYNLPAIVAAVNTVSNDTDETADEMTDSPVVAANDATAQDDNGTVTVEPAAKHNCNNGNGNGTEGCNASDKGNQDETAVKGDKAENHPAK